MAPADLVKAYFDLAQEDPTILPALMEARRAALMGVLTKGGGNTLTTSQKNGISFTVLVSLPETMRIAVLTRAISFIRQGIRPTTKTAAGFQ